jgi:S-phase kinase-associated protein 1
LQASRDGKVFEVPVAVGKMSVLVQDTLGEHDEDSLEMVEIPLPNVASDVLEKVLDYCTKHQEDPMTPIQTPLRSSKLEELVQPWYAEFVQVPREMLFDLVAAANFMDIKPLLDLTCLAVSILIKGKSASELREMFNLSAELTPEEEELAKADNAAAAAAAGEEGGAAPAAGEAASAEANPSSA